MRINEGPEYFRFSFEKSDFRRYGESNIRHVIDILKLKVPKRDRHYYPDQNEWQIKNEYLPLFNRLKLIYLARNQFEIL